MCVDSNDNILTHTNTMPFFHSRHSFIDVTIKLFVPKPPMEPFSYRKINNITPEDINGVLMGSDWSSFLANSFNINAALSCLTNNIQIAIDQLAPLKTINPRKAKQPWINSELQLLIKKRTATEKRYLRTKKAYLIRLSDEVEVLSETSRNNLYREHIADALNNKKDIWREFRLLGLLSTLKSDLHGFLPDDINRFFAGVSHSYEENLENIQDLIDSETTEGFGFKEVTLNEGCVYNKA